MELSFPTDADGFLSQECPSCDHQFKVMFGKGSKEPISYCPYCGHHGQNCWLTSEQAEHAQRVAANVLLGPELKRMGNELQRAGGGLFKISMKSSLPDVGPVPFDADDNFDLFRYPCCGENVKAERREKLFCIICGKEMDLKMSGAKKVFLSHKGVDKQMVINFKATLAALGYHPWIDEDAMPAGTPLERGLLQGMQDSCGVVFFITPSFKDEGFLETEVNYAISEQRRKGDKFAIIAMQFVDSAGNVGVIPELLKTYVWKKPNSDLEALREIVRALPIHCKLIDWRDDIKDVVSSAIIKPTTTELSDEAKHILMTAAKGDGSVMHIKYMGGEEIQTGGKSMIPDRNPRTVAHWVGGVEDLSRRRFIRDMGHKGEVFEVTREGYKAADEIEKAGYAPPATPPPTTSTDDE